MVAKSFRATSGLDAAGEKVINVGKASRSVLSDGVNVDFLTNLTRSNNTILPVVMLRLWLSCTRVVFGTLAQIFHHQRVLSMKQNDLNP